jgi:hypothetical protein
MKRLRLIYEQLEEAKRYLLRGSLFNLRLALILTDNVAELLMFNALQRTFSRDEWLRPLRKNAEQVGLTLDSTLQVKYTDEERKRAQQEFEPMVRLLQHRLCKLAATDATVLRICHRLRRDAFHKGQLPEDILEPVVQLLFHTVVLLTESLGVADVVQTYPLDDEDKAFLHRYGLENMFANSDDARRKCSGRLRNGLDFDIEALRRALRDDLVVRVQGLVNALNGFYENDDGKNIHLQRYQFWKEKAAQDKKLQGAEFEKAFTAWKATATPFVTLEWLSRFQSSVERKLNSQHASQVLASYWGLNEEFVSKEEFINEHISAVDEAIQFQIDLAKGK